MHIIKVDLYQLRPNTAADDRSGSNYEKLNLSKFSPLCPIDRTSMRRAATSLMGPIADKLC